MKQIFSILLITVTAICSAQKTEIYVIGNIHDSVPNYHPKILLAMLDKIGPDIILHEVDKKGMEDYAKGNNLTENEVRASNLYSKKNPNTLRLPFEFEGRNQYRKDHGMVPTDNLSVKLIDSLYKAKQLTSKETKIYETFNALTQELIKIAEGTPEKFNNSSTDRIAEKRQNSQYHELLKITDNRPEFSKRYVTKPNGEKISYKDGFKKMSDFWDLRNKTMAQNIYNIAQQYPGTKIVVLTGFLHRYYLIKELKKLNKQNYILKEFYE